MRGADCFCRCRGGHNPPHPSLPSPPDLNYLNTGKTRGKTRCWEELGGISRSNRWSLEEWVLRHWTRLHPGKKVEKYTSLQMACPCWLKVVFFGLFVCFSNCFLIPLIQQLNLSATSGFWLVLKIKYVSPPRPSLIVGTRVLGSHFTDSRLAMPRPRWLVTQQAFVQLAFEKCFAVFGCGHWREEECVSAARQSSRPVCLMPHTSPVCACSDLHVCYLLVRSEKSLVCLPVNTCRGLE